MQLKQTGFKTNGKLEVYLNYCDFKLLSLPWKFPGKYWLLLISWKLIKMLKFDVLDLKTDDS